MKLPRKYTEHDKKLFDKSNQVWGSHNQLNLIFRQLITLRTQNPNYVGRSEIVFIVIRHQCAVRFLDASLDLAREVLHLRVDLSCCVDLGQQLGVLFDKRVDDQHETLALRDEECCRRHVAIVTRLALARRRTMYIFRKKTDIIFQN